MSIKDLDRLEEQVALAAAPVRALHAELENDAPPALRRVLAHLRKHAFAPGFSVKALKEELGIRSNNSMMEVTRIVGITPKALITDLRVATAAGLLRTREIEVGVDTVAWRVGYSETKALRRPFGKWYGISPKDFRKHARRAEALAGPMPAAWLSLIFWRRLYAGTLDLAAVAELLAYLERLHSLPEIVEGDGEGDVFLADLAGELGTRLDAWPWPEQREAARSAIRYPTPCFSEHLYERSRVAARRGDVARAAELVRLSLDALTAMEEQAGKPDLERRALAWARLERARLRAGDAPAAERAARRRKQAVAELPEAGRDPALEAERRRVERESRALR